MLASQALITLLITYASRGSSSWIRGSNELPRADDWMAVGYDNTNNTVLLFGGMTYTRQFVTFNPDSTQFTDVDIYYLTVAQQTKGQGQHYSQTGNDLWIIRDDGAGFINIDTTTYAVTDPTITIPISVGETASLVATAGFIIVIGGGAAGNYLSAVHIYNLGTSQWLTGVPSMSRPRGAAACAIVNDKVYIIAGITNNLNTDSIEALDISALPTTTGLSWDTLSGKLASPRYAARAVAHGTDIYVVGGWYQAGGIRTDVHVIDTISGSCEATDTLDFGTTNAPAIIVANVLYAFAGWRSAGALRLYQYTVLPTLNSTFSPSKYPSLNPSTDPTSNPSFNPSFNPTGNPSFNPSFNPSLNPSTDPTSNPSLNPSTDPTKNPSFNPSINPTGNPSKNPSVDPTDNPSTKPTSSPTDKPSKTPTKRPTVGATQDDPFGEGEVSEKRDKNYTISITVHDCSSELCVEFLKDEMMQPTEMLLNDALDQTVDIKKTEIEGNVIVSVVTVSTDLYVALDTDPIAERIETELEDNGFDVEVEMIETDDDSDSFEDKEPNPWFESALIYWIIMALVMILCFCVIVGLSILYFRKRKREVVTVVKHMTAESNIQMTSIAGSGSNPDVIEEVNSDVASRSIDKGENKRKETASDSDAKQTEDNCTEIAVVPVCEDGEHSASESQHEGSCVRKRGVSLSDDMYVNRSDEEHCGTTGGNTETDDRTHGAPIALETPLGTLDV